MLTSGFLYLIHVNIIVVQAANAAAKLVVINILEFNLTSIAVKLDPGLKPNHPIHNINTPKAPKVKL